MSVLDDLNMRKADLGALSRDLPERPPELRRRPAPTPALEERLREEARVRAERSVRLIEGFADEEPLGDLALRLDLPAALVEEAHHNLAQGRPLRPEVIAALEAPRRRRATTCAEVGLSRPLAADGEEMAALLSELSDLHPVT